MRVTLQPMQTLVGISEAFFGFRKPGKRQSNFIMQNGKFLDIKHLTCNFSGDVIRSNILRSTSIFDGHFQVEIEDRALGRQKMTMTLR